MNTITFPLASLLTLLITLTPQCHGIPIKNPQCPDYCKGTRQTNDTSYVCGDYRLGPVTLPSMLPLSNDVYGYDRFGGQCPGAFLTTWFNESTNSYIYPPLSGFIPTTSASTSSNSSSTSSPQPLSGLVTLAPGTLIDRFGSEYGAFLAPFGSPYSQRALPPQNLDTFDQMFPYNYFVYEVLTPLELLAGPIAAWFGQSGLGTQFMLRGNSSVKALIEGRVLRRVGMEELLAPALG